MTKLNPAYGFADVTRLTALRDAVAKGVKAAAEANKVSTASIYKWRKHYTVCDLMKTAR